MSSSGPSSLHRSRSRRAPGQRSTGPAATRRSWARTGTPVSQSRTSPSRSSIGSNAPTTCGNGSRSATDGAPLHRFDAVGRWPRPQILSRRRLLLPLGFLTPVAAHAEQDRLGGTLFLEDGLRFDGVGFGAATRRVGEVVFTTGMVGYPESLTDPSFRGQILTFTYPLLGNYGVPPTRALASDGLPSLESDSVQVRAMVVRGTTSPSHWAMDRTLEAWLAQEGVPGLRGVDTRRLTEHLRSGGVLRGVVDVGPAAVRPSDETLAAALRRAPQYAEENFMEDVSPRMPSVLGRGTGPLVAVLDCGVKSSILRALLDRRVRLLRLPHEHQVPQKWEGRRVAGLLVGNGPGDPSNLRATIEELGRPSNRDLPTLGICLGHQLAALARGGTTF